MRTKAILITAGSFLMVMFADAFGDKLKFHWYKFVFNNWDSYFWGPESWKNKYVDRDPAKGRRKFLWGKIDVPVIFTDGWHLVKAIKLLFIFIPYAVLLGMLGVLTWYYNLAIAIVVWSVLFEFLFADILEKDDDNS